MNNSTGVITDLDKASILLLSMGEENAAGVIKKLGRYEVEKLSDRMAKLSNVSQEDIAYILQDFFNKYREESGVSGASRAYLERALDKAIGRKLARNMLDDIYGGALADDVKRLEWVPPELLVRFIQQEHIQMQALVLAFLPAEVASNVLSLMPEDKHDDILFRIAQLTDVSEYLIEDLKYTLQSCIEFVGDQVGAKVNGVELVAELVNRYNGNKEEMLSLLKMHSEDTAEAIQGHMFSFSTLASQNEETLASLFNEIPDELWLVALKGCDRDMVNKLLDSLPKRLASVYQQQLSSTRNQPISKVQQTQKEIMGIVRRMIDNGEIDYVLFNEETVGND
ncbi:FliG C-terminal domain-containing protein [Alteromonas sp. S015]|uniref:FliG C-terminal domain-containing protein n=1 Tax=Alteromonas sp. S015 TaxID=3117401 RepID=UPI002FE28DB3